jgi:membrane-bound ClpP family serine protease
MNILSRTIAGTIMIILGLVIIGFSFFTSFFILAYGIPILIVGLFIFFNKNEDKIERIKMKGGKKK